MKLTGILFALFIVAAATILQCEASHNAAIVREAAAKREAFVARINGVSYYARQKGTRWIVWSEGGRNESEPVGIRQGDNPGATSTDPGMGLDSDWAGRSGDSSGGMEVIR